MFHHCSQKYAISAAITAGIWYSLCTAFLVFARDMALKLHAHVMHMSDLDLFAPKIIVTTQGFLSGLAQVMLYAYLIVLIFAIVLCYVKQCCGDKDCGCHGACSCKKSNGGQNNSGYNQPR